MSELLLSLCSGDLETYVAAQAGEARGHAVAALPGTELIVAGQASGEGERLAIDGDAGSIEIAWTSVGEGLDFTLPDGETAAAHPIEANVGLGGEDAADPIELAGIAWSLPARNGGSLRTAWAAIDGGDLLIFFATRPPGAPHGDEIAACARFSSDGEVITYEEPLLSTEFDAAGNHRRTTLELWQELDTGAAERGGGVRVRGGTANGDGVRIDAAAYAWRLGGAPGFGGYEILSG